MTAKEAAELLGVHYHTVGRYAKRGILSPVYLNGDLRQYYDVHAVAALSEVVRGGGKALDLDAIATLATRAFVISKANEARLEELFRLVGLKRKPLGTTLEEVGELCEHAVHLNSSDVPSLLELDDWTTTLHSIDEAYLDLVHRYTASREPWKMFLDLANRWSAQRNLSDETPDAKNVYNALEAARRNLRAVAYLYCRKVEGPSVADRLFGTGKVVDKLLDAVVTLGPLAPSNCSEEDLS